MVGAPSDSPGDPTPSTCPLPRCSSAPVLPQGPPCLLAPVTTTGQRPGPGRAAEAWLGEALDASSVLPWPQAPPLLLPSPCLGTPSSPSFPPLPPSSSPALPLHPSSLPVSLSPVSQQGAEATPACQSGALPRPPCFQKALRLRLSQHLTKCGALPTATPTPWPPTPDPSQPPSWGGGQDRVARELTLGVPPPPACLALVPTFTRLPRLPG